MCRCYFKVNKKRQLAVPYKWGVSVTNFYPSRQAIVLEGKYWKRQLEAVTAEYKKWRIYYKNKISGRTTLESDAVSTYPALGHSLEDH